MLTNIVLGTIIIILIVSTIISARLIATLEAIYIRAKSIQEILNKIKANTDSEELKKHKLSTAEAIIFGAESSIDKKEYKIAGLPTHEDCPITYVREQIKQTPSKLRVTDIHLAILNKVSQSEGTFETSFKHDVNELFIKRKEWGVALEFEKDKPICYTIRKGDLTRDVVYLDQVERWLGVDKKNKDRINNSVKSPKYYDDKVKQYIEIKRNTLKGDVAVLKEVGLSAKALKMYEEPYKEEINKLRDACRQKHIETLKAKYPPKLPKGGK